MSGARVAVAGAAAWYEEPLGRGTRPTRHRVVRKAPGVKRLLALFTTIAALLLLYVAEQVWVIGLTYRLNDTQKELHAAEVATDRLQLQISELSSPGRIERIAREELHLVSPAVPAYLAEAPRVARVVPLEEGGDRPTVIARLQRLLKGALVAHAAE